MELISIDQNVKCYHCGDECSSSVIRFDHRQFCCHGCRSVYEILKSSDLTTYYDLESTPGARVKSADEYRFAYLDNAEVSNKLLDFSSESLEKVRFSIPDIHCSSCIWLLENLRRLNSGVLSSRANLSDRELAVDYDPRVLTLKGLVELLASIGYEPSINLEQHTTETSQKDNRNLILKVAVAGFCFGNIMLLSFPEYLGLDLGVDSQLAAWFSTIIVLLSLPVLFYCAAGYFRSAINGLKHKYLNIDVPIALGIIALAGRSYYEILFSQGTGYLDSLAGLLFLLLIGQWFQHQTYRNLSFNRDFKAYFPLAITKMVENVEKVVLVDQLSPGDTMVIRNQELIPADSTLLNQTVSIDYSFVSGESQPVTRGHGDYIFAGGRHVGAKAYYQVQKPVSQSYLTQLWNHQAFNKSKDDPRQLLINNISKYFTLVVLLIALISATYWLVADSGKSLFVFTSVLIVACPCALAMATPFTLGHTLRVLGKHQLFLKNAQVVDSMAGIDTVVFDKTGTITKSTGQLKFNTKLTNDQAGLLAALTEQSNHPVSRNISEYLKNNFPAKRVFSAVTAFREYPGRGISAIIEDHQVKLGNSELIGANDRGQSAGTYLSIDDEIVGCFFYKVDLREGLTEVFRNLGKKFSLALLSGDNSKQKSLLERQLPGLDSLRFDQSPLDKLQYIEELQDRGKKVMMVGDGLNDAGALKNSNVGLAVAENPQSFTPASDGIMNAKAMDKLNLFIGLARWSKLVIVLGIGLSFLYNVVGLSFAVTGNLTPLTAAILMPLSSISVVVFSTLAVKVGSIKLGLK